MSNNINLKKIEKILSKHPDVQEVAVIEHRPGVLVAYIVSGLIPDRLPYHSTCLLEHNQEKITVHTEDISYSGFCLIGTPVMKQNDTTRLYVRLPGDNEEKWFNGKIAWCRESKAGIQLILDNNEQNVVEQSINYILNNHGFLKVLQRVITGRLYKYISQTLPNENVPSVFMIVKSLPLKIDGQIDITALPEPGNNFW
ncbi:PilZ domain-containing protein [Candidatus Halobeggiatoa sp. HSG11]|nr:PilZ domain-containing protein [Candidatus Halobeggiatoa sp. HSG11]